MQNDIAHGLSTSEPSYQVMVKCVIVKRFGFLTLGPPLIRQIHLSVLEAERGQAEPSWSFADSANV